MVITWIGDERFIVVPEERNFRSALLSGARCFQERGARHKGKKLRSQVRTYLFISRRRVTRTYLKTLRKIDIRRDAGCNYAKVPSISWILNLSQLGEPSQSGFQTLYLCFFFVSFSLSNGSRELITLLYGQISRHRLLAQVLPTWYS